jgi:DNA (cytosine-5)-methyltransferase 1
MEKKTLYNGCAGFGANTHLLNRKEVDVTHTEMFQDIANVNRLLHPDDEVIVADTFQHFQENHEKYNFAWFSVNCQGHSKMVKATRHNVNKIPPVTELYGLIIFLTHFYKGDWVVENVVPFYKPLIEPTLRVGRHLFWSNKPLFGIEDVKRPTGFINKATKKGADELKKWLGLEFEWYVYYKGNHCPAQTLRNCVHPKLGVQIFNQLLK